MIERCPTCAARSPGDEVCRRCGTELHWLARIAQASRERESLAVKSISIGDIYLASRYLEHAMFLKPNPFQQKLRPGVAVELSRPRGQRFRRNDLENAAAAKRSVNNDSHAHFLGERQDALRRGSIHQRVIDLNEIGFLGPHDSFDFTVASVLRIGNSGITDLSFRFPFAQ